MGQQLRARVKRQRRKAYLARRKEREKEVIEAKRAARAKKA